MMTSRMAVAAGIVFAMAGCGVDGNDAVGGSASGGFFAKTPAVEEAPQIHVVAVSETPVDEVHDDGAAATSHDDSAAAAIDEMDEMAATAEPAHDADSDHDAASDHEAGESDDDATESDHGSDHDATEPDPGATEPGDAPTEEAAAETEQGDEYVVEVAMVEFGYVLDQDTVPVGEPVTFRFVNEGEIEHEAMFGSMHQQEEFASSDGHGDHGSESHHGEIAAITLDTEHAGEMMMVFDAPGEVLIGCHLPGHWDAGMVASFEVVTA